MRLPVNFTLPLAALVLLGGCFGGGDKLASNAGPLTSSGPAADYPVVIGAPFVIDGVTYSPNDALNSDAVGYAVARGEGGEAISIAHKTLPLPSYAEVTSLDSGKTILVRVERRGPMTNDRLVELSPGAAAQLGLNGTDKAPIRIRRVNPPEQERAALRSGQRAPDRMDTPASLLTVLKRKLDPAMVPIIAATPAATPQPVAVASPALEPVSKVPPRSRTRKPSVVVPTPVPAPVPEPIYTPAATDPSSVPVVQPIPGQTVVDPHSTPVMQTLPNDSPTDRSVKLSRGTYVQVGAYSNRQNAYAAAAQLGGSVNSAGALLRVVMGPFAKWSEAQAALVKARQAGYKDARIQTER